MFKFRFTLLIFSLPNYSYADVRVPVFSKADHGLCPGHQNSSEHPGHQLTLANSEALQREHHLVYQIHPRVCVYELRVLGLRFLPPPRGIGHGGLSNVFIPSPAITVWQFRSGHGECTA